MLGYHFVGDRLRNTDPVPPDGKWLEYTGPLPPILCERGLHASEHPFDAMTYAPGPIVCRVELDGIIVADTDKYVGTRRRILCRADATVMLRAFARRCALDVVHLWKCPPIVHHYLETGDENIRPAAWAAAWDAAWDAAWPAACDAARAAAGPAARPAAWAAARDKHRQWFAEDVERLLASVQGEPHA